MKSGEKGEKTRRWPRRAYDRFRHRHVDTNVEAVSVIKDSIEHAATFHSDESLQAWLSSDFAILRRRWGLDSEADIRTFTLGVRVALTLSILLVAMGLAGLGRDLHHPDVYLLASICLILAGGWSAIIQLWKLQVVKHRKYVNFRKWLLGKRFQGTSE